MMLTIVEYSDEQQTVNEEINIVVDMDATLLGLLGVPNGRLSNL